MTAPAWFPLDRRALIAGAAALAGSSGLGGRLARAAGDDLAGPFRQAVGPLCGVQPIAGGVTGQPFLDDLVARFGADRLKALLDLATTGDTGDLGAAIENAGLGDVAQAYIEAWYTGIVTRDGDKTTVEYLETLQWTAVRHFTKPPSECGEAFGYWADGQDLGDVGNG